jgi:hypothetical protein
VKATGGFDKGHDPQVKIGIAAGWVGFINPASRQSQT